MVNPYERRGTARNPTDEELDWANRLLVNRDGRSRNMLLTTQGSDEHGRTRPRRTWLFSAFTRYPDGAPRALWQSEDDSVHSLHIIDQTADSRGGVADVWLDVPDSSSRNAVLQLEAKARMLPPEEQDQALSLLNVIRGLMSQEELGPEPRGPLARPRRMFEAVVVSVSIQGPRLDDQGLHAQEGHLVIPLDLLRGHEIS